MRSGSLANFPKVFRRHRGDIKASDAFISPPTRLRYLPTELTPTTNVFIIVFLKFSELTLGASSETEFVSRGLKPGFCGKRRPNKPGCLTTMMSFCAYRWHAVLLEILYQHEELSAYLQLERFTPTSRQQRLIRSPLPKSPPGKPVTSFLGAKDWNVFPRLFGR